MIKAEGPEAYSDAPTLVNDSVLPPGEEWPLHAGDRIAFGKLEFLGIQYHVRSALSQAADLEEWAGQVPGHCQGLGPL